MSCILMNYYTDHDPQETFVAEEEGKIIGYITGSLNTKKYNRTMFFNVFPKAFFQAIFRKSFWNKKTLLLVLSTIKTVFSGGFKRDIPLDKFPAHLHINLDKNHRGKHTGKALMDALLQDLKKRETRGIHLSTRADNTSGRNFFEKMGFSLFKCYPAFFSSGTKCFKGETAVYIREL